MNRVKTKVGVGMLLAGSMLLFPSVASASAWSASVHLAASGVSVQDAEEKKKDDKATEAERRKQFEEAAKKARAEKGVNSKDKDGNVRSGASLGSTRGEDIKRPRRVLESIVRGPSSAPAKAAPEGKKLFNMAGSLTTPVQTEAAKPVAAGLRSGQPFSTIPQRTGAAPSLGTSGPAAAKPAPSANDSAEKVPGVRRLQPGSASSSSQPLDPETRAAKRAAKDRRDAARAAGLDTRPNASGVSAGTSQATTPSRPAASGNAAPARQPAAPIKLQAPGVAAASAAAPVVGQANPNRPGSQPSQDRPAATTAIVLEPTTLEFGDIPTGESRTGVVRLRNTSDTPYTLIDCRASCGCTTTVCPKGEAIQPGEFVEIEIQLDGGETPRKLNKNVTFLVSDKHPPLRLGLVAQSVSFVTAMPESLDPGDHPDGRVTLKAADGTPFKVLSMFPPVATELPSEAAAEQVISIDWDALFESGSKQRRLLFRLDHPKASRVLVNLSLNALRTMRDRSPNGNSPIVRSTNADGVNLGVQDLDALLKDEKTTEILALIDDGSIAVNSVDRSGQTALLKASRVGNVEVMAALIDAGANVEAADRMGRTPLSYAAQSGSVDSVILLLDMGASVHHVDQTGNTPLGWAAGFGKPIMVESILDAGAKVDSGQGGLIGFTPLIWASSVSDNLESVTLLIERGADVEARDTLEQATVVMHAIRTNKMDHVKALLTAGARLDVTDGRGHTPLLIAAKNAGPDEKMIQFLIEQGQDPTATNKAGESALDLAKKRRDPRSQEVVAAIEAALASQG